MLKSKKIILLPIIALMLFLAGCLIRHVVMAPLHVPIRSKLIWVQLGVSSPELKITLGWGQGNSESVSGFSF